MSEENGSNGGAADIVAVEVVTESVEAVDAAVVVGGVMSVAQRNSREQNQSSVRKETREWNTYFLVSLNRMIANL